MKKDHLKKKYANIQNSSNTFVLFEQIDLWGWRTRAPLLFDPRCFSILIILMSASFCIYAKSIPPRENWEERRERYRLVIWCDRTASTSVQDKYREKNWSLQWTWYLHSNLFDSQVVSGWHYPVFLSGHWNLSSAFKKCWHAQSWENE